MHGKMESVLGFRLGRFQMQGGKNWFLPKEMNANRFFWDSHWLEIWSNHFYPSMGPNGGSVAMDSVESSDLDEKVLTRIPSGESMWGGISLKERQITEEPMKVKI
jgi:hypothetical protein